MVSQLIWIGIVIAAFVVGLGSTYLIFHTGGSDVNANFIKMENAQHAQEMAMLMNENHNFTMEMMSVMIEDPTLQLQMIGHMAENPEAMKQMMNLMDKEMIMFTMTDSDQIQMMEDMMDDMMQRMQNDPELEQAMMEHMEQMKSSRDTMMGTDDSMMNGMMDTKTNFPSSELPQENSNLENEFDSCTSDWYITGYFLPIESDYSGESVKVSVDGVTQSYLSDFLEVVKIEGWGKTNADNYLAWYHDDFTISDTYLDAYGNDLIIGIVAIDDLVIERGSELTIPTLPEPWNDMVFSGLDEGPSINGKHIDVFTGEGVDAENETFRITGYNNQVCMQN
ncbi:MAG: hypothetical protein HRO68_01155 [Nitrosopumilus sp.]|nr:hypothetical protein [Nitrosopumilus sp.]